MILLFSRFLKLQSERCERMLDALYVIRSSLCFAGKKSETCPFSCVFRKGLDFQSCAADLCNLMPFRECLWIVGLTLVHYHEACYFPKLCDPRCCRGSWHAPPRFSGCGHMSRFSGYRRDALHTLPTRTWCVTMMRWHHPLRSPCTRMSSLWKPQRNMKRRWRRRWGTLLFMTLRSSWRRPMIFTSLWDRETWSLPTMTPFVSQLSLGSQTSRKVSLLLVPLSPERMFGTIPKSLPLCQLQSSPLRISDQLVWLRMPQCQ